MRTILIAIACALANVGQADAQTCVRREFVQHQQDAARGSGRISLAFRYCSMKARSDALLPSSEKDVCESEMGKTVDALRAAHAGPALRFSLGGCAGDYPSPDLDSP
jgi:hypothetical protein